MRIFKNENKLTDEELKNIFDLCDKKGNITLFEAIDLIDRDFSFRKKRKIVEKNLQKHLIYDNSNYGNNVFYKIK